MQVCLRPQNPGTQQLILIYVCITFGCLFYSFFFSPKSYTVVMWDVKSELNSNYWFCLMHNSQFHYTGNKTFLECLLFYIQIYLSSGFVSAVSDKSSSYFLSNFHRNLSPINYIMVFNIRIWDCWKTRGKTSLSLLSFLSTKLFVTVKPSITILISQ